jgi:hypothetical protein
VRFDPGTMRRHRRIGGVLAALSVGLLTGLLSRGLALQTLPLLIVWTLVVLLAVYWIVPWALRSSDRVEVKAKETPAPKSEPLLLIEPMFLVTTLWRENQRFISVGDEMPNRRAADGFSADGSTYERHTSIPIPDGAHQ